MRRGIADKTVTTLAFPHDVYTLTDIAYCRVITVCDTKSNVRTLVRFWSSTSFLCSNFGSVREATGHSFRQRQGQEQSSIAFSLDDKHPRHILQLIQDSRIVRCEERADNNTKNNENSAGL